MSTTRQGPYVRNDLILTDLRTPDGLFDHLTATMVRSGRICLNQYSILTTYPICYEAWQLTQLNLLAIQSTKLGDNPIIWGAAMPRGMHRPGTPVPQRELDEWFDLTTVQLADKVASSLVRRDSDRAIDPEGHHVIGDEDVPLIVVHKDLTEEEGFVAIVRSIHLFQLLVDFTPAEIWVHTGTRASLEHFQVPASNDHHW